MLFRLTWTSVTCYKKPRYIFEIKEQTTDKEDNLFVPEWIYVRKTPNDKLKYKTL